jgi:signal peptidase II
VPKAARWYGLAGVIIVLDQLSKWLVLENLRFGETIYVAPFWNWVLTFNPGAAFSFLADQPGWQRWLFTALALGISGWIAVMLRQHPQQKLLSLALTLVMGGALGNVIDRVWHGHVVDFLDFHWQVLSGLFYGGHFPAFNVADMAISCGAAGLILDEILRWRRSKSAAEASR